jgi:chromosome segregation ATPase
MTLIKRDVNFGLFFLILATLILLTAFTMYFQKEFRDLTSEYKQKLDQLEKVTRDLSLQRSKLNETSYQLKIKEQSVEDYNVKYTNLKNKKELLETQNAKLTKDLSDKTQELIRTQGELDETENELDDTKDALTTAQQEIDKLTVEKKAIKNDRDSLKSSLCATIASLGGSNSLCS